MCLMKKNRSFALLTFYLILVLMITACSKSKDMVKTGNDTDTVVDNQDTYLDVEYKKSNLTLGATTGTKKKMTDNPAVVTDGFIATGNTEEKDNTEGKTQDKIIYRIAMEVETREFDAFMDGMEQKIAELGGYVESSEITSPKYKKKINYRDADVIIRIPKDKISEFTNSVEYNATVINMKKTSEDVTLQYVDIDNRKKAIEVEQKRLLALIKKANKIEDIVTLETRLTSITYELEQYETQLRTFNDQVTYSTITLHVDEIDRVVPGNEKNQSINNRIKSGFFGTLQKLKGGLANVLVWLATNSIFLLISAIFIIVIVIVTKNIVRKRNEKNKKNGKKTTKKTTKTTTKNTTKKAPPKKETKRTTKRDSKTDDITDAFNVTDTFYETDDYNL